MQKRKIVGGLVAAGAVLGVLISGWLPKFGGSGTGNGTGSGTVAAITKDKGDPTKAAPQTDLTKANPTAKPATPSTESNSAASRTTTLKAPPKMPVLEVYIKGHSFQIKDPGGSGENVYIKMEDILKVAKLTTGNEDGVRIRILRYRSAKYMAWAQLTEELGKIGIATDAIRMPKELLEDPKPQAKAATTPETGTAAASSKNAPSAKPAG